MNNMCNINFQLRKSDGRDYGYIWVSFYVGRQKIHFTTKLQVQEKCWSESKQRVTAGDRDYKDKNLILDNIYSRITGVFVKYRLRDKKLTKDTFWRAYRRPSDFETFIDFCKYHQQRTAARTGETTKRIECSVFKKIEEKFPGLAIDELDTEKLDEFYGYLLKTLKNNLNTASKNRRAVSADSVASSAVSLAECVIMAGTSADESGERVHTKDVVSESVMSEYVRMVKRRK